MIKWEHGFKDPLGEFDTTGTIYELRDGEMTKIIGDIARPDGLSDDEFGMFMFELCLEVNCKLNQRGGKYT